MEGREISLATVDFIPLDGLGNAGSLRMKMS